MCPEADPIEPVVVKPNPPNPPEKDENEGEEGDSRETVSRDVYSRVKQDMLAHKDEAKKLKDQLASIEAEKLKSQNQWKEYAQTQESEAKQWKTKYESTVQAISENSKLGKVKEAALALGLRPEALGDLELMEFKDVIVETTDRGRQVVHGAKTAAEKLKALKPHWFSDKRAPNINGKDPVVVAGADGTITMEDLKTSEAEAKKTGDYTAHKQKLLLYKTQKK